MGSEEVVEGKWNELCLSALVLKVVLNRLGGRG